jgi:shikimate dehydrogenase
MRVGLIGYPVAHSASPKMQGAAFAAVGLDWQYELWNTPLDDLRARVAQIRACEDIGGANVTIPHKQNVFPLMDEITPHARAIGAVNTIIKIKTSGAGQDPAGLVRLLGDNTDWLGFLADLRYHGVQPETLGHALVLGAGGSARAIVYALASCGVQVCVLNRDPARAVQLVEALQAQFPSLLRADALGPAALREQGQARLIVNCTSAGMSPNAESTPWPDEVAFPAGAILYDLVYKPRQTRLMHQAQAANLKVIGGIGMLTEQGAAAFERWTAIPAARVTEVMRMALE